MMHSEANERESYVVYVIVDTDAPKAERYLGVWDTRPLARAAIDAGEYTHKAGRIRIRRARMTLFES